MLHQKHENGVHKRETLKPLHDHAILFQEQRHSRPHDTTCWFHHKLPRRWDKTLS